ncbi:EscF/YscF/HrpA family type III secretion system needle major subunit [Pandoraea pulmonicola]|uniref:Type III secretion system needle complex protein PrgI n=1 Tax=Pandoraea pulmonicola TaxID=93221 RepID=A0AAJ5D006_PANPU|nr:EscF/YscF/HrpA family type III secretion system needle major subunit [Pandoraea pulmonicola]SUA90050.1 type III secretion system needle complex protein PrgI [Pandoraea pulmonicola]
MADNFITKLFDKFANAKVKSHVTGEEHSFTDHLNEQIDALGTGDSSDPQKLARYQKAMMMFSVHTNAQASVIKGIGDVDKGIIRDFN